MYLVMYSIVTCCHISSSHKKLRRQAGGVKASDSHRGTPKISCDYKQGALLFPSELYEQLHLLVKREAVALRLYTGTIDKYTGVSCETREGQANVIVQCHNLPHGPSVLQLGCALLLYTQHHTVCPTDAYRQGTFSDSLKRVLDLGTWKAEDGVE
jgi:hypothetical protein